ncbi:hypothetical protein [Caloranaerobacter ferrireducens]|uniref:hypothetical protein n=1 Tax=Caloranaerobacter ferrireducens TaxID=1323370 RepID=UPI00084D482E|nr:hypothetical protein [Caloranaerobacter ferrireducens]
MVTNAGLSRLLTLLDNELTHIGIGIGTAPTINDTTLDNEQLRKQASSLIDGFTLVKEIYFDETEGNGINFTNAGVFGNSATDIVGTGELFSGGSINVAKNNTQSLTISFEITVEGA